MNQEYKEMNLQQLKKRLPAVRRERLVLGIRKHANELEDFSAMKKKRREIARILTKINELERLERG